MYIINVLMTNGNVVMKIVLIMANEIGVIYNATIWLMANGV